MYFVLSGFNQVRNSLVSRKQESTIPFAYLLRQTLKNSGSLELNVKNLAFNSQKEHHNYCEFNPMFDQSS